MPAVVAILITRLAARCLPVCGYPARVRGWIPLCSSESTAVARYSFQVIPFFNDVQHEMRPFCGAKRSAPPVHGHQMPRPRISPVYRPDQLASTPAPGACAGHTPEPRVCWTTKRQNSTMRNLLYPDVDLHALCTTGVATPGGFGVDPRDGRFIARTTNRKANRLRLFLPLAFRGSQTSAGVVWRPPRCRPFN